MRRSAISTLVAVSYLSVFVILVGCSTSNLESRGHAAYNRAKSASGAEKLQLEKEAYTYFRKAVSAQKDKSKINNKLRNRFIESTIRRANLILDKATAEMDALDFFVEDIDSVLTPDVEADLRSQYATLLLRLADSVHTTENVTETLRLVDHAIDVSGGSGQAVEHRNTIVQNMATKNLELAEMEYEEGVRGKGPEATQSLIRAEFYCKTALFFDKDNQEASALMSKIRQKNLGTYSAFEAVIQSKPDTILYDSINNLDILLSVQKVSESGKSVDLSINMYNYSYNPLRLKSEDFAIVDTRGNVYNAYKKVIDPEFLDQEVEKARLGLSFPKPAGPIQKLVYQNGDHYSEKNFM